MSRMNHETLPPEYFDGVYSSCDDPWGFETRAYEKSKYARTLAALPRQTFARALEIGCSIGVLTRQLALRCGHLLAVDISDSALATARQHSGELHNVEWRRMQLPAELPQGSFDLIMVSEVAYYWSAADLSCTADWMVQALNPDGVIMMVHWTDPVPDYPLEGDFVHEHFIARAAGGELRHRYGEWHPRYRLDVFDAAGTAPPDDEAP